MVERAMRGRCDDLIEQLGREAMDNPAVRNAVHAIEAGYVSREAGLVAVIRGLAVWNKTLVDNAIKIANVTPGPSMVVVDKRPCSCGPSYCIGDRGPMYGAFCVKEHG